MQRMGCSAPHHLAAPPRRLVLLACPEAQILDITGPSEAFAIAERIAAGSYAAELVSSDPGEMRTSGGLRLLADAGIEQCDGPIDTLIVAGGIGVRDAMRDERMLGWLREAAQRSRRVAAVCTGAFLLAEAGLLDGRRATTHWAACEELARRHPAVSVEVDPIFVRDGRIWTSAGVTAGIDLALALVEEDLGPKVALEVARTLVLFVRRPGGQAQFSATLSGQQATSRPLRDLEEWIADHLDADLSVAALAERAFMSPRHFARVFAAELGVTPARHVESLRIERARLLLASTERGIEDVARSCGFRTVETMRRAFTRTLRVSPGEYRRRFGSSASWEKPPPSPVDALPASASSQAGVGLQGGGE